MTKKASRTREARQRRQKQRRQNRWTILLLAIVIVAVVAVAMVVVSNQPVEAYIPPDLTERYDNISRSFSVEGYPQLGDLNAPVTLAEYASFACPGCEALHSDSFDAILDRVRGGQVLFTYVPMQTGSIPNAQGAARAALCAGRQGMFWEMHDVLFDWQTRYANTAYSQNRLLAGAEGLGLNTTTLTNCFNSAAISETLDSAITEDVTGTPTVQVNGVTIISERAGAVPSTAQIVKAIDDATPNDWGLPDELPEDVVEETADLSDQEADIEAQPQPQEPAGEDESASSAGAAQSEAESVADDEPAAVAADDVSEEAAEEDEENMQDADATATVDATATGQDLRTEAAAETSEA
ncbi:MAG: thioredoxin domain-containing protein [Chloroflexi bacterium]|nr:thioredoxin domain-containing protein [Chloroflexota bacterium]